MHRILILAALLLAGCTPEQDPMIFNPQPLERARWETDDPRDTFPDTLGRIPGWDGPPFVLPDNVRLDALNRRDGFPDYWD